MVNRKKSYKTPNSFKINEWGSVSVSSLRSAVVKSGAVFKKETLVRLYSNPEDWPTPVAADSGRELIQVWLARAARKEKEGINLLFALRHAVQIWPTPAYRDYKGQNSISHIRKSLKDGKNGSLGQLPNAILYYAGEAGLLNPLWVEWLMGYPPNWTDAG